MIVLDTHILIWWLNEDTRLSKKHLETINKAENIFISVITLWEIAKLVEHGRIKLTIDVQEWLNVIVSSPKIQVVELLVEIIVESTRLPGSFHKDPADQLIVATSRVLNCNLLTEDDKILKYEHVQTG